jgi:hypothetical protein
MWGVDSAHTPHVQLHSLHVGFFQVAFRYPWMDEGGVFINCSMKRDLTNVYLRPSII